MYFLSYFPWTVTKLCPHYYLKTVPSCLHETSYKYQSTFNDMQSARTITLAFILSELFPLDSVTKSCPLYNLKTVQISINIRRYAECKNHNSCIYTFWVVFAKSEWLPDKTGIFFILSCKIFISPTNVLWILAKNILTTNMPSVLQILKFCKRQSVWQLSCINKKDFMKTVWVISCPLYNLKTGQAIFMKFHIKINQH